jgi:hypothetical protein
VLACLRKGETFAELAAGFGAGVTTAWRHVHQTVPLAGGAGAEAPQRRPGRDEQRARTRGRGRDAHPHRPGRRRPALLPRQTSEARDEPAGHRQPRGDTRWVPGALPGPVHDKKAEWTWGVLAGPQAAALVTLAGKGHPGSTYAKTPYRGKNKPEPQKQANRAHPKLRPPGEPANAQPKTWHILRKLRRCPWRAGKLAKAIHTSQTREAAAG